MNDSRADRLPSEAQDYARLFDRYGPDLLRLAAGILFDPCEAEDVVQDAFMRLYDTVQWGKLKNAENAIPAFLRTTTRNLAIDAFRKRRTRRRYAENEQHAEPPNTPRTPFDWSEDREFERKFYSLLGRLSDLQRATMVLRAVGGESHREIAKALGIGVADVKTHLRRARAKLEPLLSEYEDF